MKYAVSVKLLLSSVRSRLRVGYASAVPVSVGAVLVTSKRKSGRVVIRGHVCSIWLELSG